MLNNSEILWKLLKKYTPNGTQTLSKMPDRFVDGVYPKVVDHGHDGHIWDVDGNKYIDLISGLGAISVGYGDLYINHHIKQQLDNGAIFSLPHTKEYTAAKRLVELVPSTEQWKFFASGTEACMGAVKAARAYTNRLKVMVCGYHGWADWYTIVNEKKAGIPGVLEKYITKATYNNIESFLDLESRDYACLIMEPMVFDEPAPRFLESLKALCKRTGTVLIFDEVVTGGRYKGFVAQNDFQVMPDVTVLSKGVANGHNFAAVGSTKSFMATFERNDFFVSGTFGGSCLGLTACLATLDVLAQTIDETIVKGQHIKFGFDHYFKGLGICKGYPTRLTFDFPTKEHKALFMQEMCLNGVLIGYSNFVMANHTNADIDQIITAFGKAVKVLKAHYNTPSEAIKGKMPVEVFRLR